ncbi:serine O-acetyltransferase [Geopsychrobacter electrodiphilus]|uniref:serine O-acetyltransferase n=1 Tax=Geopsychrobacter electrodiphilus TaxID=225196 RepID=UPI0012EB2CD1|nr:serine acetyltransferase [Geopsychrobacter electrodiphilus]
MLIFDDIKFKAEWLYGRISFITILRAICSDATMSMVFYRIMAFCAKRKWTMLFALIFHKLNAIICGCVIGINARFGRKLLILHSVGVVVNSSVVAGDEVVLESGVVIGAEKGLSPVIGSRVFIGSGAKIVGGLTVGSDVLIGANAVVVKDIPCDSVAVGVPAKVINKGKVPTE